jgi:hypothetical protein
MSLDSDSLQSIESEGDAAASNGTHDWGGNGSGAVVAEAEAAADEAPVATADETTVEAVDEAPVATADETTVEAIDEAPAASIDADPADDGSAFLAELTRAMQATAGAERERAIAEIERRREQHLAAIEARRVANADEIRALANTDLAAIDAWAEGERMRIASEHETRAAALRDDLERSLAEHGLRIDREIAGVEDAIAAHRTEVDAFFAAFDHETDPVVIAQNAGRRPTFPALDSMAGETDETATTDASTTEGATPTAAAAPDPASEGIGVGVMNPAPRTGLADAWAAWSDPQEQAVSTDGEATAAAVATEAGEAADPATGPETLDVFAVTSSSAKSPTSSLIQSMPINRPLGWLRRGPGNDDSTKGS